MNIRALVDFLTSAGFSADFRMNPTLALAISVTPGRMQENPIIVTQFDAHTVVSWPSGKGRRERTFSELDDAVLHAVLRATIAMRRKRTPQGGEG